MLTVISKKQNASIYKQIEFQKQFWKCNYIGVYNLLVTFSLLNLYSLLAVKKEETRFRLKMMIQKSNKYFEKYLVFSM